MLNILEKEVNSYFNKIILIFILALVPIFPNPIKSALILFMVYISISVLSLLIWSKRLDFYGINNIIISFICLIVYFIILSYIYKANISSLAKIIQLICCFILFMTGYSFCVSKNDVTLVKTLIHILSIVFIIDTYLNSPTQNFIFGFNGNAIGMYFMCLIFIYVLLIDKMKYFNYIMILLMVLIVYFSNSRSALLSIMIVFSIFFISKTKLECICFSKLAFFTIIFFVFCFSVIYPVLYFTDFGINLNKIFVEYTNKTFFSGRQIIWANILSEISDKFWIGYGLDKSPSDIFSTSLSSHNLYFQIVLQSGIIGLFLLLFIIFLIFNKITLNKSYYKSKIIILFLYAMLIQQTFEVALTQNHLSFGLIMWFILGLGCNVYFLKTKI